MKDELIIDRLIILMKWLGIPLRARRCNIDYASFPFLRFMNFSFRLYFLFTYSTVFNFTIITCMRLYVCNCIKQEIRMPPWLDYWKKSDGDGNFSVNLFIGPDFKTLIAGFFNSKFEFAEMIDCASLVSNMIRINSKIKISSDSLGSLIAA